VLSADQLLQRLDQNVLPSNEAVRDLPERQQTMTAAVAWSYHLLDRGDQRAFRCLGLIPGRFPIDAAAAVLGDDAEGTVSEHALAAVARLIDKSLLVRDDGVSERPLYRMLETVRAYASNEARSMGERDRVLARLASYACREAAIVEETLVSSLQAACLDRVHDDLDIFRAALTTCLETHGPADAADIAWGLMLFWLIRGHVAEGLRWYELVLAEPSLEAPAETKALTGAAMMLYAQGEMPRARTAIARAAALARGIGSDRLVAPVETIFGHVEHASGNLDAARDHFRRGADTFQRLGLRWGAGSALSGLAGVEMTAGNAALSEQCLDESAACLQGAGPWFLCPGLCFRAVLAMQRQEPDVAIACMRESLTYIRAVRDKYAYVYALLPLAAAAMLKGNDGWTARILGARDAVIERTGVTVAVQMVTDLERQAEEGVRARLGPERWARAYDAGRTTSIDALLRDIDRLLGRA
jgi:hypothetical protein